MDLSRFTTAEQLRGAIEISKMLGQSKTDIDEMEARLKELEKKEAKLREEEAARQEAMQNSQDDDFVDSVTPIYDTLVKKAKFKPGPEKTKCICDTVNYLLEDGPDAMQPGLLLGRIQCGKTDTFVKIMALAFDKGIDVCIVMTKGTNALAKQTVTRMEDDFKPFAWTGGVSRKPKVSIYDIMDIKNDGLTKSDVNNQKLIIICKKEDDNLKHLLFLFNEKQPLLKQKKVLIVDDEADFASWNYMKNHGEIRLAVITRLINEFVHTPGYCRYLQVTATPYSLYLQPDQTIEIEEDGCVRALKPRFTTIVPTHDNYVGGDQYFVKPKEDEGCMYSYLFHPITEDCLKVMKNKNTVYLKNMLTSAKIEGFRYAILSYLMATVIRKMQEVDKYIEQHPEDNIDRKDPMFDDVYRSSCLIHLQVATDKQVWQETLVLDLIQKIKEAYTSGNTDAFDQLFDDIYEDFSNSNKAAREHDELITVIMPEKESLKAAFTEALDSIEATEIVHVVNSDRGVQELLDKETGQLKLKSLFNIFIGGSILDRGITINNMLSFFYGRTTTTYQQDTVLQHMRQYGSRSKEDMAVTRLHTTYSLYDILEDMNALDNQLRNWLISNDNNADVKAIFVALSQNSKVHPCSPGKLIVSDTVNITPNMVRTPSGFQTGPKTTIKNTIDEISERLAAMPGYVEDEFFDVDKHDMYEILHEISSTFVYDEKPGQKWGNYGMDWDESDMIGIIEYCTGAEKDKIKLMVRKGMNMSRKRANGRFVDAPATGSTDLRKAYEINGETPALLLFLEEGTEAQGWRGTPFYWPVVVAKRTVDPVMFVSNVDVPEIDFADIDLSDWFGAEGDQVEVLKVQCKKKVYEEILTGETKEIVRKITDGTASKYLSSIDGGRTFELDEKNISDESQLSAGIHTYNDGKFPFKLLTYDYIVLYCRDKCVYKYLLAKVDNKNDFYHVEPAEEDMSDEDMLVYPSGKDIKVIYNNFVIWTVAYKIKVLDNKEFILNSKK